jgi:NTP pyrophosphatase (non-canonical NTP hydrolase)
MPRELGDLLTLKQLQEERNAWVAHNFPPVEIAFSDLTDNALGVAEEAGELAHAVLKWKQGIRGSSMEHWSEVFDAAGDIIVYLAGVVEEARKQMVREGIFVGDKTQGLTLQDALEYAWAQVKNRDWQTNRKDGSHA